MHYGFYDKELDNPDCSNMLVVTCDMTGRYP